MLELVQACLDIFGHGDVHPSCGLGATVVPAQCEATVSFTLPVFRYFIPFFQNIYQHFHVFFSGVFDAEVVDP